MHERADDWQQRYEAGNTGWDRGGPNPQLMTWLETEALAPCRVVVPGCGHGHEVVELAARGFEVTAIDIAATPTEHLKRVFETRDESAEIVVADALQYQPARPFDAIYEQTFLCAIAPELRARYVQQLAVWLKPGGQLFALFMQCADLGHPGPPFHCRLDEMQSLFSAPTWHWPATAPQRVDHPSGLHELATIIARS